MSVTTGFASCIPPFADTATPGSTRRHFCSRFLLGSVGLMAACRSGWPAERAVRIEDFLSSLNRVADGEPMLPGVQSLVAMQAKLPDIATGLSAEDMSLLNGALYLDAQMRLRSATLRTSRGFQEPAIREALSRPIDTSAYDREFIAAAIRNARARMATDGAYAHQIAEAGQAASMRPCNTLCKILVIGAIILLAILIDSGHA